MTSFWQGEKIQLCAVEEEDVDTVLEAPEAADTDLDRYEDFIYWPISKEKRRTFFKKMAERSGKDDTYFWLVKDVEGRYVGSIGTFDCDRRVGSNTAFGFSAPTGGGVTPAKPSVSSCATIFMSCVTKRSR